MDSMLVLRNRDFVVFYDQNEKEKAIEKRKTDPRMRYARIIEIIQALPSKIENDTVYLRRYKNG